MSTRVITWVLWLGGLTLGVASPAAARAECAHDAEPWSALAKMQGGQTRIKFVEQAPTSPTPRPETPCYHCNSGRKPVPAPSASGIEWDEGLVPTDDAPIAPEQPLYSDDSLDGYSLLSAADIEPPPRG